MPSGTKRFGIHREGRSLTDFIQSLDATTGPAAPSSARVTYGTRGFSPGCSRFQRSASSASLRSWP